MQGPRDQGSHTCVFRDRPRLASIVRHWMGLGVQRTTASNLSSSANSSTRSSTKADEQTQASNAGSRRLKRRSDPSRALPVAPGDGRTL